MHINFGDFCQQNPDPPQTQRMLAFISDDVQCVLMSEGEYLCLDIGEIGHDILIDICPNTKDGDGLWVWEGIVTNSSFLDCDEYEPEYIGEWRRATEDEVLNLSRTGNPWRVLPDEVSTPTFNSVNLFNNLIQKKG